MGERIVEGEMTGTIEAERQKIEGYFEWDEKSQLYYHASTGFYHDPNAGWYYNSKDGLYYKFEEGNYVLLGSDRVDQPEGHESGDNLPDDSIQHKPETYVYDLNHIDYSLQGGEFDTYKTETVAVEPATDHTECSSSLPENPAPPSEWLEDTLIELYLSGYRNQAVDTSCNLCTSLEKDDGGSLSSPVDGNHGAYELEEGEWIPDESQGVNDPGGNVSDEGISLDEANWQAQYGQVVKSDEELLPDSRIVDLWDWAVVPGRKKGRKSKMARLVGRLVRQSTRLHPSMPSGGFLLKTAPICEARLDLVRVTSGQVYKLKTPSAKYLASLSTYDSSNPTKDWGLPELSIDRQIQVPEKPSGICECITNREGPIDEVSCPLSNQMTVSEKHKGHLYRDRAAERRALHGSSGVAPGQKKSSIDAGSSPPSPECPDEAASEALNMSFGVGSYARRILESMGWKEGEALGSSTKGLIEPLNAIGNKGNAGLGWDNGRRSYFPT